MSDVRVVQAFASRDEKSLITMKDMEIAYLHHVIWAVQGNVSRASRILKMNRSTIVRWLAKHPYQPARIVTPLIPPPGEKEVEGETDGPRHYDIHSAYPADLSRLSAEYARLADTDGFEPPKPFEPDH